MPDFSFPSWILPKESPWEALLKGAQVGNMIAQNRYRNQALYAQIQQQQQENDLREREFMVRGTAQDLHNQALRRKLDYDSHDLPLMTDSIAEVQRETDMDKLRSWPTPQFSDSDNAIKFNQILSSRILRLSSTTSQRQLADDIAYNTKFDDALDSDLRQISKQGLNERGLVDGMEGAQLRQFAADEQQRRNEEAKLRVKEAEAELIRKRQVEVARIRAAAIQSRVKSEPSLAQALMRHTNTVMSHEGLNYSEAQDAIRAEWNASHATEGAVEGTTETPISRKISDADQSRINDFNKDAERLQKRIDTIEDAISIDPENKKFKPQRMQIDKLEDRLRDVQLKKINILQKYEPAEKRPGMGEVRKADEASMPPTTTVKQARTQADVDEAIRQANEAIAQGKDPVAVKARLKEMGIQLKE